MSKLIITNDDRFPYWYSNTRASNFLASMIANGALSRNIPVQFIMDRELAIELATKLELPEGRYTIRSNWDASTVDAALLYRNNIWVIRTGDGDSPAFKAVAAVRAIYSRGA